MAQVAQVVRVALLTLVALVVGGSEQAPQREVQVVLGVVSSPRWVASSVPSRVWVQDRGRMALEVRVWVRLAR